MTPHFSWDKAECLPWPTWICLIWPLLTPVTSPCATRLLLTVFYSRWLLFLKGACFLLLKIFPQFATWPSQSHHSFPSSNVISLEFLWPLSKVSHFSHPLIPNHSLSRYLVLLSFWHITSCSYLFHFSFTYYLCFTHIEGKHHNNKDLVHLVRNP